MGKSENGTIGTTSLSSSQPTTIGTTRNGCTSRSGSSRVVFERPCTDSSPKLLPDITQHICTLHCCTPGEIWEQETRPNHNTSGRTVHRTTGRGGEYGEVWKSGLHPDQPSVSLLGKRSYPTPKPCGTDIS